MTLNFTDIQVLTLVRAYPGLNLYQLEKQAKLEMGKWPWTFGKVQKAVERLKKEKMVEGRFEVRGGRSCQEIFPRV